jgi:SAM-dependent methyltransferase
MSLGKIYVSDFIDSSSKRGKIPLELIFCNDCKLLQLRHSTNPEILYREYWYKSGINETIIKDLEDITSKVEKIIKLQIGDIVVDIGCNDGTLLRSYKTEKLILVGFEPALNLIDDAKVGTTFIIPEFFNANDYYLLCDKKAKAITCVAMFYDLDNPNNFVEDIKKVLDKDGIWIIEQRYLPSMLEQNDIGNICHEHIEYYSLLSLKNLVERHGLKIFDVELNSVNGGSFRMYIKWKDALIEPLIRGRVEALEEKEKEAFFNTCRPYKHFAERSEAIKKKIYNFIKAEHNAGKIIHVYGASTKGNTLLQYYGIDHKMIEAAAERDPRKFGKKTVGTEIPIISEEESRQRANYFLILPWHFLDVFIKRELEFLLAGGKFIVPLPEFKILEMQP